MDTNQPVTLPSPVLDLTPPPPSKWEREKQAFRQLLPNLLLTHRGQYVAIHDGQVADAGDNALTVALRVLARVGNVDIYVGLVTDEPEPVGRSGIVRNIC
jgi:hypothetical protein